MTKNDNDTDSPPEGSPPPSSEGSPDVGWDDLGLGEELDESKITKRERPPKSKFPRPPSGKKKTPSPEPIYATLVRDLQKEVEELRNERDEAFQAIELLNHRVGLAASSQNALMLPNSNGSLTTRALIDPAFGTPLRPLQSAKKRRAHLSTLRQHPLTELKEETVKGLDPTKVLNFNAVQPPKAKFSEEDSYSIAQGIAIRQNNKFDNGFILHEDQKTKTYPNTHTINGDDVTSPDAIVVGGVVVKLLDTPNTQPACEAKRFPFSQREGYDADQYDQFYKSATSYTVLAKNNKLSPITVSQSDHKILVSVRGLHQQLRLIKDHFSRHDVDTVFRNIIVPVDVKESKDIHPYNFNLFEDWPKLLAVQVANSNACYNLRTSKHVRDMLAITYECLRTNTDQKLWDVTVEEHDKYDATQQGGPLILFLLLKRIHDVSDASLKSLLSQIKAIKISKIKGENVEEAISLINNGQKVLEQCSQAGGRNYVPQEFPEIVLDIMQTSTIEAFNQVFDDRKTQATTQADLVGGTPKYDSVEQTCNLALNTYKRMSAPGPNYCWAKKTKDGSAFSTNNNLRPPTFPEWQPGCCINCCKPNCRPDKCKTPKCKDRMKQNFEKLKAHKKKQKDKRSGPPNTGNGDRKQKIFDEKGRPLKRNKHGKLVVDSALLAKTLSDKDKNSEAPPATDDAPVINLTQDVQDAISEVDREAQSLKYTLPQDTRAPAAAYMASVEALKNALKKNQR